MGHESTLLLLPDFSARVCGRSISARLFSCRAGLISRRSARARPTLPPPHLWNTPSFIIDHPQEFSGGRGPPRGAPFSPLATEPIARSRLSEEPVASLRRFPLSFLGDRWRGDIDFGSASSCRGPAADEPSPCEV